jgi:DNA-binding NarL/FixJ family response regulator
VGLKVLVADDQPLIRAGIRSALGGVNDIEIVGEASSDTQLSPLIARSTPDVLLLDLHMSGGDALLLLETLRDEYPDLKIIALADRSDPFEVLEVLGRGACGYMLKSIDPFDLAGAIRQVVRGTFYSLGGLPLLEPIARTRQTPLSEREVEVLQLAAAGLTNRAIAKDLWLSDQTVKFHLNKIYRKLGVANRTEAARYAVERGLVAATPAAASV